MHVAIASVSLNQIALDFEGNYRRVLGGLEQAKKAGAALVCFSELCITGYGCEDWFLSSSVRAEAIKKLEAILPYTVGLVAFLGMPLEISGKTYNAVAVVSNGQLKGFYLKKNLARDGVYYEPRWFHSARVGDVHAVQVLGKEVPAGDLVFDLGSLRVGIELCEDAWVENRPALSYRERGVNCIINPSASHLRFGYFEKRKKLVETGSAIVAGAYVYCNAIGNESGRLIFDGGNLFASKGALIQQGERFSFSETHIDTALFDFQSTDPFVSSGVIDLGLNLAQPSAASDKPRIADWENGPSLLYQEFSRAVALGLWDYKRKTGTPRFVVSLSGGIDSSAVAVLVKYMDVLSQRDHVPVSSNPSQSLLTCVYQATAQSSEETRKSALSVAAGLGYPLLHFDIENLVGSYTSIVESAVGRSLDWKTDDTALQNIQARVRSPGVWLLANVLNAILLTTSNRSEASVGYCTMDGDTSGGLCPLGGVSKDFLRSWLRWAEVTGISEVGPLGFLAPVLALEPTAELRPTLPGKAAQTDEADLMPYEILQKIEYQAIVLKKLPHQIIGTTQLQVEKFFRLWSGSQWKRERLAPAFHIDEYSVDPKSWCRFPIISGLGRK